jgi:hypothetical protein
MAIIGFFAVILFGLVFLAGAAQCIFLAYFAYSFSGRASQVVAPLILALGFALFASYIFGLAVDNSPFTIALK